MVNASSLFVMGVAVNGHHGSSVPRASSLSVVHVLVRALLCLLIINARYCCRGDESTRERALSSPLLSNWPGCSINTIHFAI